MLTPEMCRAARAILRWTVQELAGAAGLAEATIRRFEASGLVRPASVEAMVQTLQGAGLELIPAGGKSLEWQHVKAIVGAMQLQLESIAYVYLVSFRTKDDAGSRLPSSVVRFAADAGFYRILDSLAPRHLITMDRPSHNALLNGPQKAKAMLR